MCCRGVGVELGFASGLDTVWKVMIVCLQASCAHRRPEVQSSLVVDNVLHVRPERERQRYTHTHTCILATKHTSPCGANEAHIPHDMVPSVSDA